MTAPLLIVDDLRIAFPSRGGGTTEAVRGVSFTLGRERLGIVGESGAGKSQTGRAILGLTPPEARVTAKRLEFDGIDMLRCPEPKRMHSRHSHRCASTIRGASRSSTRTKSRVEWDSAR